MKVGFERKGQLMHKKFEGVPILRSILEKWAELCVGEFGEQAGKKSAKRIISWWENNRRERSKIILTVL